MIRIYYTSRKQKKTKNNNKIDVKQVPDSVWVPGVY